MERLLAAEMDAHLGYGRYESRTGRNGRNGYSPKTVETVTGPVTSFRVRRRPGGDVLAHFDIVFDNRLPM